MPVLSEIATMTEVAQGTSLARFGDGELLIMAGLAAGDQRGDKRLADELWRILNDSPCLVGVPHTRIDKDAYWGSFLRMYGAGIYSNKWYGSSFVSRHDWAPWTKEYRKVIGGLWREKVVTLISPEKVRLKKSIDVIHFKAPLRNAFEYIEKLEACVEFKHHGSDSLVLLSCGPTATVLADRLTRKGIWAVDLGNFGKFL